ncbi:hypothetical protein CYFUS_001941 [Cystobacter fuscus]|uniref:Lantibiotic ABC transporter permease n=1 Tax=Cystobacter fuscus TaxID=43 RepID=A0A250J028_9BACT|nr:peptidase domain-containing ABC transporter [Cystobacter fuscus]ATB36526.1 hypothetical protein CYFUS_001941 [Cystobacter fuscus]
MTPTEPKPNGLLDRFPALRELQARLRERRVPVVRQLSATECGAACLTMVLNYHGRAMRLEEVRDLLGPQRDGLSALQLLQAARRFGLRGRGVSLDGDSLEYLPTGAILHWRFSHFVVFERLSKHGVDIVDPAIGRQRLPLEEFLRAFTGVALLLEPGDHFETSKEGPRRTSRYVKEILRQSDSLSRVLVVSFMLQLFALAIPALTGLVVDRVVPRGDQHLLLVLSLGLAAITVFNLMASLIRGHMLVELRTRIDSSLSLGFLEHLVSLSYAFFQVRSSGDLLARMNTNAAVREILSSSAVSGILDGSLVLIYLVVIFIASPTLGLLVLGLATAQVLIFVLSRKLQGELMARGLEMEAQSQSYQVELLTGIQSLKAYGAEHRAVQHYSSLLVRVLNVSLQRGHLSAWVDALNGTLRLASPLVLLCVGTWRVLEGDATLGTMLSLNALAAGLLSPLANLVATANQLQLLGSYITRLDDVLDAPPEQSASQSRASHVLRGGITLEGVSFRYGPMAPLVVKDLSVRITPGQFVAIVGRSGAGKSTLANLLIGLYPPTTGRLLYDGVDLASMDLQSVRSQMGVVLQDVAFFSASVRANIAMLDPEVPLAAVEEAARAAQVHEDIMAMPMRYETPMVDRGAALSGGQRQRLSLARALVRKPAVLLLDEATSALDAITERKVQEALAGLRCTRIVIAHRLSTVVNADLILVMDGGQLVEAGTHAELLARGGLYTALVQAQLDSSDRAA